MGPDSDAVFAITGSSQAELADRPPEAERAAGWERTYHAKQQLWRMQGPVIEQLPVHHKGEVLSGVTQSA